MGATGIVPALFDGPLRDRAGEPVGIVEDLLCDARSHRPLWLVVRLAADGRRTVVPAGRPRLAVAWARERIEACPAGPENLTRACRHYGVALRCAGDVVAVHGHEPSRELVAA